MLQLHASFEASRNIRLVQIFTLRAVDEHKYIRRWLIIICMDIFEIHSCMTSSGVRTVAHSCESLLIFFSKPSNYKNIN